MGIAMSITAFPVLARIVQERGIHKTRLEQLLHVPLLTILRLGAYLQLLLQ
jgi:Kef-type K+ transport system membrane component KefB